VVFQVGVPGKGHEHIGADQEGNRIENRHGSRNSLGRSGRMRRDGAASAAMIPKPTAVLTGYC
jgi:hypothetical protein